MSDNLASHYLNQNGKIILGIKNRMDFFSMRKCINILFVQFTQY